MDKRAEDRRDGWPDNMRKLQNIIERTVFLSPGPALEVPLADLRTAPAPVQPGAAPIAAPHMVGDPTAPRRHTGDCPRPLRSSAEYADRSRNLAFWTSVVRDGSGRFPDEESHEGRRPSRVS